MVGKLGMGTSPMTKETATNDSSALQHRLLGAALCWRKSNRRHAQKIKQCCMVACASALYNRGGPGASLVWGTYSGRCAGGSKTFRMDFL